MLNEKIKAEHLANKTTEKIGTTSKDYYSNEITLNTTHLKAIKL